MAKNYTFAEVARIVRNGTDLEAIADIGRRYPILLHKVTNVVAKAGDEFVGLMNFMPDYLTANKVNTAIKAGIGGSTESDDNDETENIEAETESTETEETAKDYESMSGKELWDLLGKAGKRKLAKSTKKADLVEACKQAFGAGNAEAENEDEAEEETTEAGAYDGKSAMDLFKECKKRGIKAAPKKPAKFYADLLIKDDAKNSEENETESEDWDEEEEAPKKPAKKETKKPAKKEEANDEDDDWDI